MTTTARPLALSTAAHVTAVVAAVLRVPETLVALDTPFAMLGMDSLAAVELTAALGDALNIELDPNALHDYPDVGSLARFIECGAPSTVSGDLLARLQRDAILPADITPADRPARATADARNALLTGATGFVGAYIARALLDETPATIHCLVREAGAANGARHRVRDNLAKYGLWKPSDEDRLRVVASDLARPLLGLTPFEFADLSERIDVIYHGAAAVNWIHGYDGLRGANVVGTREILRLACAGAPKPVHFLSSLGVCYSTRGPRVVDERDDMLAAVDGLHLGYAQSKCVGESLVRAAAARGLPVTITRPSLVTGDSRFGRSNVDDLVSRFIAGCIRLGAAPDLDWRMDCVPVDHVAQAVVRLASSHGSGLAVAHLASPRPRHWRECVLWMRLCGYELELLPYREWAGVLRATNDTSNALHSLRSFFLREVPSEEHLTLPELYEEPRRSAICTLATRDRLRALDVHCAPVNTQLLDRYFDDYVKAGAVPEARSRRRAVDRPPTSPSIPSLDDMMAQLTASLAARFDDPALEVTALSLVPFDTDDSIVAELTSWRHGTCAGLFRASLALNGGARTPARVDVIVKAKAADQHVLDVAESVARLAGPALGETYARFREWVGFTRCHLRELALYEHADERLRRHTPAALATLRDDVGQRWMLVLEDVGEARRAGPAEQQMPWSGARIDAAMRGLAEIHAVWYGREAALLAEPWSSPARNAPVLEEMTPLWCALAQHAVTRSPAWRHGDLARIHYELASKVDRWARPLAGIPHTLVHNDFNSRNITVRDGAARRLCAYDWELATVDVPQRDLAEFMCFALSPDVTPATVAHWIERYRRLLALATGHRIDPGEWREGFRAAMAEFLVDRLAMYAMVDRFRPQRFLGRVVRTWEAIYAA